MKKIKPMYRRTFLRGMYSTALSLPVLDIMLGSHGEAFAQTGQSLPKFYYSVYAGLAGVGGGSKLIKNVLQPSSEGSLNNLPEALTPLSDHGLTDMVQVISNLTVPYGSGKGQSSGAFHETGHLAYLSGLNNKVALNARFDSPDVLLANYLKAPSPLDISVQASGYGSRYPGISFSKNNSDNHGERMPNINLYQQYLDLSKSIKSEDQSIEKKRVFEIKKRGTVLDLVKQDINNVKKSLGQSDKQKLDRHITMFRDLEEKLKTLQKTQDTINYCTKAKNPGKDQDIGKGHGAATNNQAYSGEVERAKVAIDLVYMALTCGLTQVANLIVTWNHPWLNSRAVTGINGDFHNLTHGRGNGNQGIIAAHKWHVNIYSELTKKLRSTQMGNKNMLEQSLGLYFTEGGTGRNYYGDGKPTDQHWSHSSDNSVMLAAGNMGGLKPGKHFDSKKSHHAKVFLSLFKAMGHKQTTLGDISGHIPDMFS